MIIGFLSNTAEPFYRGGYERRVGSLARELARQGHTVRLLTSCPSREIREGVDYIPLAPLRSYFNSRGVRNGWADLGFLLALFPLFWRWKRRELEVLDVCATPFLYLPLVALLCWWKKIPAVLTCHEALLGSLPAYVRERGFSPGLPEKAAVALLSLIYRLGTGLFPHRVAVSDRTAAGLAAEGFPAAVTVPFGLEKEAFFPILPTPPAPGRPVQFIFCGRLTPIKQVRRSVEALLALRGRFPFHFHILGTGSELAALKTLSANVPEYFTLHGEVSEDRKRELLAESEVFLLSSPREGFAIAALEAMARGCTVLVANDPSAPNGALDFVQPDRNGLAVPPDAAAWTSALLRLDENGTERFRFRCAAWEKAGEYRIENQSKHLAAYYSTLLP